jgi:hypothetical protein
MTYEYSGYLKRVLETPDPARSDALPGVVFTPDDISQWHLRDLASDLEWQHIPANFQRTPTGVRLEGRFNEVHQIGNIPVDDPSFWVALSSLECDDDRFPIDVAKYPVAEITYRCVTPNALPAWQWVYPGGVHFDGLMPTQDWRTIARRISHGGFPKQVDSIILRLYSTAKGTESFEVESIRFRALTEAEAAACERHQAALGNLHPPKHYPVLDDFFPFGCHMDAASSKRLASMLGVSLEEYWALAFEDIAKHYHNCVAIEKIDRFTEDEWREVLALAGAYGIKFFVIHDSFQGSSQAQAAEFIDTHIRPYVDSQAILAWALYHKPPEHAFPDVVSARLLVEQVDAHHPSGLILRDPNAFPLFAPYLPIIGVEHFRSHVPWQLAQTVRTHLPLCGGQQMWVIAPGFIYATDTPAWHSCPEMRMMLNHALANGVRGWFTFAYHNDPIWIRGSCQRTLTGPFLTFSDLWSELGQRVEHCSAFAPILLNARPVIEVAKWFTSKSIAHVNAQLPQGVEPASVTQLRGQDYDLFCVVSNDVREMTTVLLDIALAGIRGRNLYDITDYVRTRQWASMPPKRHLEMFPGQMHLILVAKPEVCNEWRDQIAARIIANDRLALSFDLALVRAHNISTSEIEDLLNDVTPDGWPGGLESMQRARDSLQNLLYSSPEIYKSRSKIIEASAAACACDGSLCRLLGRGKVETARQWGFKVIPLTREFTNLRLELRRGRGEAIFKQCEELARRAHALLSEIRALS